MRRFMNFLILGFNTYAGRSGVTGKVRYRQRTFWQRRNALPRLEQRTHGGRDIGARNQVRPLHGRWIERTVEMHVRAALDQRLDLPLPLLGDAETRLVQAGQQGFAVWHASKKPVMRAPM